MRKKITGIVQIVSIKKWNFCWALVAHAYNPW
jgi:hypothetical protein